MATGQRKNGHEEILGILAEHQGGVTARDSRHLIEPQSESLQRSTKRSIPKTTPRPRESAN